MTISHDRRLTVALAAALALLVILGVMSFVTSRRLDEAAQLVAQTQRVIAQLQRFRTGVEGTETGARGYLLTGERTFLTPYFAGRVTAPSALAVLRRLSADDPRQTARLRALGAALDSLFAIQDDLLAAGPQVVGSARPDIIRAKQLLDGMRSAIDSMSVIEQGLLRARQAENDDFAAFITPRAILLADVIASLFFSMLLAMVFRDVRRRERTERELRMT
ncbi:MAG: CHASE3 domain-containing protein, partial [Longimicrobiales bacterium]